MDKHRFKVGDLVTLTRPIKDNDTGDMVTIDFAVVIPSLTAYALTRAIDVTTRQIA